MTNKQTQTHAAPEPEQPTAELLLRRFKLMEEVVESIRQKNLDAGLDLKRMGEFVQWRGLHERKVYDWFLAAVTNPKKPGKFWQIADLKAADIIPEDEESEHEGKTYPYRRLDSLMKIRTADGKLFLRRHETWFGLTKAGQELSISVNDLDYYVKPKVTWEYVPKDPKVPDGPSIRVGSVRIHYDVEQPGMNRVYLTPYDKAKVDEFLKYAGPLDNHGNGTSLLLIKEGVPNPVSATYEQFIAEDFDETFKRIRTPAPEFKDFYKHYKKAAEDVENNHQYQ
jgi:hypothetical protein